MVTPWALPTFDHASGHASLVWTHNPVSSQGLHEATRRTKVQWTSATVHYLKTWTESTILTAIDNWIGRLMTTRWQQRATNAFLQTNCFDKGKTLHKICIFMTVFQAGAQVPVTAHRSTFDTDSREVYIDNCATACITNNPTDCHTVPKPIEHQQPH